MGVKHEFAGERHAAILSQHIERAPAADGEQPLDHMPVHRGRRLRHEPHKRVLYDVACALGVAQQARGVADERRLVLRESGFHEPCVFMRWSLPLGLVLG